MGCWNGTCGISQLSITAGKKVKAVVIVNDFSLPEASGFCYNSDYASPYSFVFEGDYNDYGSVENIKDTKSTRLFKEFFAEGLKNNSIEVKPDSYYDKEMFGDEEKNYSELSFENIVKIMERDRVSVKIKNYVTNEDVWTNMGIFMVHNDVYESVRDSLFNSTYYDTKDIKEDIIAQDCLFAVEDMFEKNEEHTEDELLELFKNEQDKEEKNRLMKMIVNLNSFGDNGWDMRIRKSSDYSNQVRILKGGEGSDSTAFNSYHRMLTNNYNPSEKQEIIDMLSEMIILINIMVSLRKPWASQPGKGSQSFDQTAYLGLAEGIKKVVFSERSDVVNSMIYCTKTWTSNNINFVFQEDEEYKCIGLSKNGDLILDVNEKEYIEITYEQFSECFEY